MIRHRAWFVLLTGLAAASSGCGGGLMQEQQAVVVRFDEGSRGLTCLFVYQGLHVDEVGSGEAERAKNLDEAKRQLADFLASGRKLGLFLFGRIDNFDLGKNPEDDPDNAAILKALVESLRVRNDAFFLDPAKGLCLRQTIAIGDYAEFARAINEGLSRAIDDSITKDLANPSNHIVDVQIPRGAELAPQPAEVGVRIPWTAKLALQAAARAGHRWLAITPGKIELRLPVSPEDAASILKQVESSPRPDDRALIPMLERAIENFRVKAGPDGLTIAMGDGSKRTIAIRSEADPRQKPRRDAELIEYARTLGLPFDRTPDVESLIRAFSAK